MKIKIFILLLITFNSCYAQMAKAIVDDACKDGSKLYSEFARINIIESYKITSETESNSPERIVRLQKLESQLDELAGRLKLRNRETQEEWVKKGIDRNTASLWRMAQDSTIYSNKSCI